MNEKPKTHLERAGKAWYRLTGFRHLPSFREATEVIAYETRPTELIKAATALLNFTETVVLDDKEAEDLLNGAEECLRAALALYPEDPTSRQASLGIPDEPPPTYALHLLGTDTRISRSKLQTMKVLRSAFPVVFCNLKVTKEFVERATFYTPQVIGGLDHDAAKRFRRELQEAGAVVDVENESTGCYER